MKTNDELLAGSSIFVSEAARAGYMCVVVFYHPSIDEINQATAGKTMELLGLLETVQHSIGNRIPV